jgi:hypothetical protein
MLWYKAWLETRLRVLLVVAVILFVLYQVHTHSGPHRRGAELLGQLWFLWLITPMGFAGSGVRTESPFRVVRHIQGSQYFTLSLPVSRLRLLAARTAVGLAEVAGVIAAGCCLAALVFPEVRTEITLTEGIGYALTVFACGLAAFGISTVLATFLDQQWQAFAAIFALFSGRWLIFGMAGTPSSPLSRFDFFWAMGAGSPLNTHAIPWLAMCASAGVGAVCFLAAMRIEQARQY